MSIWIGIDPGTHTGFAVWDSHAKKFVEVATFPLWRAMDEVRKWQYACDAQQTGLYIIFEDARKRTWFKPEHNASEYRGKLMGAGAAKRDSAIWDEYLTAKHIHFEARKPQAGMTKWDDVDYWQRVTGWNGRSSEHSRDAALLVLGR